MDELKGKEILLGTYEAFVLGYKISDDGKNLVWKKFWEVIPNSTDLMII